jgi:hypothetical protein
MESYFIKQFIKSNKNLIQSVQYNILVNNGEEPYLASTLLEKINVDIISNFELQDNNYELFVYNVFDSDFKKAYNDDKDQVIKKISFELMYFITHKDFNLETCEITNNNTYLDDTLIPIELFFKLNKK